MSNSRLVALDRALRVVTLQLMGKKTEHPEQTEAKIVIYSRVDPTTVAALDEICDSMRPKPTRAQLIDAALAEYVERHAPKKQKAGQ